MMKYDFVFALFATWCLHFSLVTFVVAEESANASAAVDTVTAVDADAPRPNIVLIMCDDMGYSDIGCYGGEIDTPNIDRLAREGMRFTQFYNCAKCTTTRAAIVTGRHPWRGNGGHMRRDVVTLGEVLQLAGYQTALSGKWHLGSSQDSHPYFRGFDEFYGLLDGCCNFFDPAQRDPKFKGGRLRRFGHNDQIIKEFPEDYYTTDAFTDHAIEQIRNFSQKDAPFFVHVCYTAPHYPLHAKPKDIAKYRGKYQTGWEALRNMRHQRQTEMGLFGEELKLPGPNREVQPWEEAPHKDWQDLRMAVYAAMIDCMDQNIGRILKTLEDTGNAENTLICFLSDNGGCAETPGGNDPKQVPGPKEFYSHCGPGWAYASNTPFRRYKSWVHEGGIATPMVAWWPGKIQPNSKTPQVAHIIDFMPTFAELAGVDYPQEYHQQQIKPVQGISIVPILCGKERRGHEMLAWEWSGNRALRMGDWKLCWDRAHKEWELYDLARDRTEFNDLAGVHPERVVQMSEAWFAWAADSGLKVRK